MANNNEIELSSSAPIVNIGNRNSVDKWSETWWAEATPELRARRCKAHRKNGVQCKRVAINGATVCRMHGGAARHVKNAARARLQNAADRMARELLKMAVDDNVADSVKLQAIRDALDRAGVSAKTEVELVAKPFEMVFEAMESGNRAEHRRRNAIEAEFGCSADDLEIARIEATGADLHPTALVASEHAGHASYIDAEITDGADEFDDDITFGDESDLDAGSGANLTGHAQPITPGSAENRPTFDVDPSSPFPPGPLPLVGLVSIDTAVSAAAAMRAESARVHRARRR